MKNFITFLEAKKEATFDDIVGGRHSSMHGGAQIVSKVDGKEYVFNYVTDKSGKWEVTNEKNATAIAVSKMAGKNLKKSKIIKEELMTEASYFDMSDIEDWKKEIEKGIKAPVVHIQISTLGGEDRVSLMVKFSMDKEASKGGTEWHNSRHANLRVDRDGTLEMFQMSYKFDTKRLRKSKIKSAKDVVKKINDWIKKVK